LRGVNVSAQFASICSIIGMVLPMLFIMGLAIFWLLVDRPIYLHFAPHHLIPHFDHAQSWISLTAIMTTFLGMELATVHVRDVKNPQKNFPKALLIAVVFILVTMIFGSLAIAMVIPGREIHLVDGIMQAFSIFLKAYHLAFLEPVIAVLILIGSLGGMVNWMISLRAVWLRLLIKATYRSFLIRKTKRA